MTTRNAIARAAVALIGAIATIICIQTHVAAQVPQQMNYQAAVRDSIGLPVANKEISVRFSILRGSNKVNTLYVEMHRTTTDDLGLFVLAIGNGQPVSGTYAAIDWSMRDYWLKVEIDLNGGMDFKELGVQQLFSVPFALMAERSRYSDTAKFALRTADGGTPGSDSAGWHLTGNSGTDPVRQYAGTSDSVDFVLRTNATERVRIGADGKIRVAGLANNGKRIVVTDGESGGTLGSRALVDLIDQDVLRRLDVMLTGDSVFIRHVLERIDVRLAHDSTFVTQLTRDSLFINNLRTTINTLLLRDSVFISTLAHRLDTLFRRDTLSMDKIVRGLDTLLAHDSVFIATLTSDSLFVTKFRDIGERFFWSLTGSRGTDPSRNFIGTADSRPLAIRTDDIERMRIAQGTGNVGIGTVAPAERLHVAGDVRVEGLAGTSTRLMAADADGKLRASSNLGPIIVPMIDTLLGNSTTFITSIITNNNFLTAIHAMGDTMFWSLNGSTGTNPSRNFIGTRDEQPLAIRTDNTERVRVDASGNVGIGTTSPADRLHVAGSVRSDALAGTTRRLMVAEPDGRMNASSNLGPIIVPMIDTLLANDPTFITSIITNNNFTNNIRAIGDTMFWSLNGSVGTDPSRNFVGTRDAQGLALRTNNTERVRVDATGNVGIGTTTPADRLHVAGNARVDGLAGTGPRLMVAQPDGRLSATNNIGPIIISQIDTTLANSSTFVTALTGNTNFITSLIGRNVFINGIKAIGDTMFWSLNGSVGTDPSRNFIGTRDAQGLALRTNNTERVRVDATGNVGIGTTTPADRLHVAGNARVDALAGTGSRIMVAQPDGRLTATNNIGPIIISQIDTTLANSSTFVTALTGNTSFITSLIGRNVFINGIRAIGDTMFWSLNGSVGTDPSRNFIGTRDAQGLALRTNNTERVRVDATGNVGIGTTTPTDRLHVAGNIKSDGLAGTGSRIMVAQPDGRLSATSNIGPIIISQIDTTLANSSTFVTALTGNTSFITSLIGRNVFINGIRAIGDTMFWSLNGSVGTDPSRNFIGTRDAQGLALRTNNTERVRVDAAGNVGIGTTTPTDRLHVAGNIKSDGLAGSGQRLMVAQPDGRLSATSNIGPIIISQIDTTLANSSTFVTALTGNTSFITSLVAKNAFISGIKAIGDTMFWSLNGSVGTDPSRNFIGTRDAQGLALRTNNTERVRVDATGNVGIGTTTPADRLHVAGNARVDALAGTGSRIMVAQPDGRLSATNNIGPIIISQIDTTLANSSTFVTALTGNTSFITSLVAKNAFISGIKAIGDTMFWSLNGSVGTDPSRNFIGTRDAQGLALRTNNTERVRVDATGNVGIGTTTPADRLHVAGNARVDALAGTGSRIMVAQPDGRLSATNNIGPIIISQIDTALANSSTFVTALTGNTSFITSLIGRNVFINGIRAIGDTMFWSLNGSVGTDPSRNFIGTRDAQGLALRTNNTERVRVDATGNVGIGTTTPTDRLHVAGNIKSDGLAGTGSRIMVAQPDGRLTATNNIGPIIISQIDTTLANSTTFVTALTGNTSFITSLVAKNAFISGIKAIGDTMFWSLNGSVGTDPSRNFIGTRDAQALALRTNNTERVRVDATGNVGIGTTTPADRLHVAGNARVDALAGSGERLMVAQADGRLSATNNIGPILVPQIDTALANSTTFVTSLTTNNTFINRVKAIGDTMFWSLNGSVGTNPSRNFIGTRDAQALALRTNNTERVRVDATGNVGIGTATPGERLHVAGDIRADGLTGLGTRIVVAGADGKLATSSNVGPLILPLITLSIANDPTFILALTSNSSFTTNLKAIGDTMFWSLNGSVGTDPLLHFLGTRDARPLAFRTNNLERLRIDATGNIGIGTTTPTARLHVAGNLKVDALAGSAPRLMVAGIDGSIGASSNIGALIVPQIDTILANSPTFINSVITSPQFITNLRAVGDTMFWSLNGSVNTDPLLHFLGTRDARPLAFRTSNLERLRIDATGNVGVGTTTPTARLHVAGNIKADALAGSAPRLMVAGIDGSIGASSNVGALIVPQIDTILANSPTFINSVITSPQFITNLRAVGDTMFWSLNGSVNTDPLLHFLGTRDARPLAFRTNNLERLRIDATGNVGIGTTTPTARLHVAGNLKVDALAGSAPRLMVAGIDGSISASSNVGALIVPQIDTILANSPTFVNSIITSPQFATNLRAVGDTMFWSLNGSVNTDPLLHFLGTRDARPLAFRTNNLERLRIDATGNIGIGTTTPTARLHVAGNLKVDALAGSAPRLMVAGIDGSIGASSNIGALIVPQIDTILANSPTFINSVITSPQFITNLRAVGDTMFWSLNGSVNTDPLLHFLGTRDARPLAFRTNNLERLRIDATGNIGIGTTTPTARLHVAGNLKVDALAGSAPRLMVAGIDGSISASSNIGALIVPQIDTILANSPTFINSVITSPQFITNLRAVGDTMFWSLNGSVNTNPLLHFLGTRDARPLAFRTNNLERVRIDATGNVGIGTTTPGERLHVQNGNLMIGNNTNVAGEIRLQEASGNGSNYVALRAPALDSNLVFEFPASFGAANTVLTSNGMGGLSWTNPSVLAGNSVWSVNGNVGLGTAYFGTLDDVPLRFITGSGGPNERLRITANGLIGVNVTAPLHRLHVVNDATTDEMAGLYGVATAATVNQAIGVWGDAPTTGAGNTGTIGVLATGNGNTVQGTTNVALQVNDGGISVGRTTETGAGYTVVEGAASGVSYSAQGPSGVIEVDNLGGLLGLLGIGQSLILNRVTIHNRYVTPNSIILVQVINASGTTLGGLINLTFSTLVDDRAAGSFKLSASAHFAGLLPLTLGASDGIRLGYVVINPGQ